MQIPAQLVVAPGQLALQGAGLQVVATGTHLHLCGAEVALLQRKLFLECMGLLPGAVTPYRPHFTQGRALITGAEQGVANPDCLGFVRVIGTHKPGLVVTAFGRCLQAVVRNHEGLLGLDHPRDEPTP